MSVSQLAYSSVWWYLFFCGLISSTQKFWSLLMIHVRIEPCCIKKNLYRITCAIQSDISSIVGPTTLLVSSRTPSPRTNQYARNWGPVECSMKCTGQHCDALYLSKMLLWITCFFLLCRSWSLSHLGQHSIFLTLHLYTAVDTFLLGTLQYCGG